MITNSKCRATFSLSLIDERAARESAVFAFVLSILLQKSRLMAANYALSILSLVVVLVSTFAW